MLLYGCKRLFLYLKHKDKTRPLRKGLLYILIFAFSGVSQLHAQSNISGVVNKYYKVNSIDGSGTYITLENVSLTDLHAGDKVVLMQMTGVDVDLDLFDPSYNYNGFANAGSYEMLAVKSVNDGTKRVEFTVTLNTAKYTNGEKLQLVKIYEDDYATVTGQLTADAWDGNKGGVVALVIYKKLTLNANIDVSGKGFAGGKVDPNYPGTCRANHDTLHFPETKLYTAGGKGESNIENSWVYTKGPGRRVIGGGGGLGYFAGAGGGSNYGSGGQGGYQKSDCGSVNWIASGGCSLKNSNFYDVFNRITMGGGGGASTEDATHQGTNGGRGGGLIILLVDTLTGAGSIISQGESITTSVSNGGAGGGAGGTILLDINSYASATNTSVSVRGGNGGSTNTNTGAGGGGSGGLIYFSQSLRPSKVIPDTLGGTRGLSSEGGEYNGGSGARGGTLKNLSLQLNGFLFNSVNGDDIICAGQTPDVITASQPKGGTGSYTYSWQYSLNGSDWNPATGMGTGDLLYFQPIPLYQTTHFRRWVSSGGVTDTSLPATITVYPKIKGNTLEIRDTICSGVNPGTLMGDSTITGGNGTYSYQWQFSTDNPPVWTNNGPATLTMAAGTLTQTTYYRRIITSAGVCTSTSNQDTITVLPLIQNNTFISEAGNDTTLCANVDAGTIHGSLPTGGDGIYSYQWLFSTNNIDYSNLSGQTNQHYSPPDLTSGNYYYKRTVYSGEGNACSSISASYHILVYPEITNNIIATDSFQYCYNAQIDPVNGQPPGGGNAGNYAYRWFRRQIGENWTLIPGAEQQSYSTISSYYDTTQFCRVVLSGNGQYFACIDSSNIIQIDVIPQIHNTLISQDTALCEGQTPDAFIELPASGGAGGFAYLWQIRTPSGTWVNAPAVNNAPSYTSGPLSTTTQFRRVVTSQICVVGSTPPITITVYDSIRNNSIGGSVQYACFNTEKLINGSTVTGGNQSDIRYNWEQSFNGSDWSAADGANNLKNYTTSSLTDTAFFRRIVLSGNYDQCSSISPTALIRINPLPSGDIMSFIDTACAGDNLTVNYTGLAGNGPWSISLGAGTNVLHTETDITDTSGQIVFPVYSTAQIRILELLDDSLCAADLTANAGVVDVTVFEMPVAYAGEEDSVCGLAANLVAIPSVGSGMWSSDGASFTDPSNAQTQVTAGDYGIQAFEWSEINWQCSSSDVVEITFYEPPEDPDAGENQLLDYRFETTLNATPPTIGSGTWSYVQNPVIFTDSTLYNTGVTLPYPATGDYVLMWTVVNGVCPAVFDTITITIGEPQQFTGFSPNGDNVNDFFIINLSGQVDCELTIYDRNGNKIVTVQGRDMVSWNGTFNNLEDGQEMPEGTYYYILKEGPIVYRGYIELRR